MKVERGIRDKKDKKYSGSAGERGEESRGGGKWGRIEVKKRKRARRRKEEG